MRMQVWESKERGREEGGIFYREEEMQCSTQLH
jgi:hypothetical protein